MIIMNKNTAVRDVNIFYRKAGKASNPSVVLLHGIPTASHGFRRLIPALSDSYHVVAPDMPGFGNSDKPDPEAFPYTFDHLASYMERFLFSIGQRKFSLVTNCLGINIGLRILAGHPDWIESLIVINGSIHENGFAPDVLEDFRSISNPDDGNGHPKPFSRILTAEGIESFYYDGVRNRELISPDSINLDKAQLAHPYARRIVGDLLADQMNNFAALSRLREQFKVRRPPTMVIFGGSDPLFTQDAPALFRDQVPRVDVIRLDTGHYPIEEHFETVVSKIRCFLVKSHRRQTLRSWSGSGDHDITC